MLHLLILNAKPNLSIHKPMSLGIQHHHRLSHLPAPGRNPATRGIMEREENLLAGCVSQVEQDPESEAEVVAVAGDLADVGGVVFEVPDAGGGGEGVDVVDGGKDGEGGCVAEGGEGVGHFGGGGEGGVWVCGRRLWWGLKGGGVWPFKGVKFLTAS